MKNIGTYLLILAIGVALGFLGRPYLFRGATKMLQKDTIVRYDTLRYSGLQLKGKTYELELPKIDNFYIPMDSVRIEYRDTGKTQYIVLPRKAYHTRLPEAEIWHSGVDSRIDSLAIHREQTTIREAVKTPIKHELLLFADVRYGPTLSTPVGVAYNYYPLRWIGVGGAVEYDILSRNIGARVGVRLRILNR